MPQLSTIRNKWHLAPCSSGSPPGRIGHTFCADAEGNNAYVYGGVNEAEQRVSSNYVDDFWEYNILSKQWRMVPLTGETQCSRAFHSSVWFGDLMYVFGGCNGRGRFNRLFSINSEGDCQLVDIEGTPPTTRYCHSAVLFDGRMFIYGGKCGGRNSNRRLDDLFCCDLRKPSWRVCLQTGDVPPPRSAHSAVTYERSMVIFGGRNSDGECCPDCYLYYFDTQVWRKVECPAPHLFGRARNCAVVHFGNVVVFGGWNGKKKLNDLFTFNIEANIVEATTEDDPACPSRRECLLAVLCRNTMVVFGGRFRGSFMNDTAELYLGPKKALDSARLWVQAVKRPDMLQALHLPRQVVDMIERCGQVVVR